MSFSGKRFTVAFAFLLSACGGSPKPTPAPTPRPARPPASAPASTAAAERQTDSPLPLPRRVVEPPISGATVGQAVERFLAREKAHGASARHVIERIDLNGDRQDDALVLLQSRRYCSSRGCALLIFIRTDTGYEMHSRLLLGRTPLIATESHTRGWRDLVAPMTTVKAGMRLVMLKHDGAGYPADADRLPLYPADRDLDGKVLFSDD